MLKVKHNLPLRARFGAVDVHTHMYFKLRGGAESLDDFVKVMDRNGIKICVSLDGQLGPRWLAHEQLLWTRHRDRFVIFTAIDWLGDGNRADPASWDCNRPDFAGRVAHWLAEARERGASGVKVHKALGLEVPSADGTLARIDDPRWDPIWQACGQLGLPVLIHTADPAAFFEPVDEHNERWEELMRHPEWSFHGPKFPRRDELLAARNRVIERHPETIFIGAHVANCAEDLEQVSQWLDRYENLYVDIASRIGELGRQPYTARRFLRDYADRILFGSDGPWPESRMHLYWRFLETQDEYFPYSEKPFPPQGFWQIYGVHLDDATLHRIYHENAARIIPGVRERLDRLQGQRSTLEPAKP
jgi:predicted TIM-barrel fold metal-dependent hydrolase